MSASRTVQSPKSRVQGQLPRSACPMCRYEMDSAIGLTGKPEPDAGDLSLCINCGAILQFNEILVLKLMPPERLTTLHAETREKLLKAQLEILRRGPVK